MRGHKVVIPLSLRESMCNELHSSHFGIVKMKAEARKRFWFPGVDTALERLAGACAVCAALRPAPPHAPLASWCLPPHPFYRLHLDFLGPYNNHVFLIIVDAYSKWVECYSMFSTYGSKAVIDRLCDFMSRFGIPHTLVSDNGSSFTSQDFKIFCAVNGIKHVLSPVYHPSSNGQAESFVKIIKKGLKGIILSSANNKLLQANISKLLFDYRNSKNSTTGKSPAELVFGRELRSRLDLINPLAPPSSTALTETVEHHQFLQAKYYKGVQRPDFKANDNVWLTKHINKKITWIEGIVKKKIGKVMYVIYIPLLHCEVTRHIDQLRAHPFAIQSDRSQWDPDVVPDLPSLETTTMADAATTSADAPPPTAAVGPAVCEGFPPQPEEGERVDAADEVEDPYISHAAELATPPRGATDKRRQAISPQFATPTPVQDSDSYTE